MTIFVIFLPKIIQLLRGKDVNKNFAYSKFKQAKQKKRDIKAHVQNENGVNHVSGSPVDDESVFMSTGILSGLSDQEKVKICREHIDMWNDAILRIGDGSFDSSHGSHNNNGIRSNNPSASIAGSVVPSRTPSINLVIRSRQASEEHHLAGHMSPLEPIQEQQQELETVHHLIIGERKIFPFKRKSCLVI